MAGCDSCSAGLDIGRKRAQDRNQYTYMGEDESHRPQEDMARWLAGQALQSGSERDLGYGGQGYNTAPGTAGQGQFNYSDFGNYGYGAGGGGNQGQVQGYGADGAEPPQDPYANPRPRPNPQGNPNRPWWA